MQTYTVKPGDSIMKIAYMHNVSERSLLQVNNLLSNAITPGQVLKLPLKKESKDNKSKNHVKINEVTAKGFKGLGEH